MRQPSAQVICDSIGLGQEVDHKKYRLACTSSQTKTLTLAPHLCYVCCLSLHKKRQSFSNVPSKPYLGNKDNIPCDLPVGGFLFKKKTLRTFHEVAVCVNNSNLPLKTSNNASFSSQLFLFPVTQREEHARSSKKINHKYKTKTNPKKQKAFLCFAAKKMMTIMKREKKNLRSSSADVQKKSGCE